jgi:hypothetical protein
VGKKKEASNPRISPRLRLLLCTPRRHSSEHLAGTHVHTSESQTHTRGERDRCSTGRNERTSRARGVTSARGDRRPLNMLEEKGLQPRWVAGELDCWRRRMKEGGRCRLASGRREDEAVSPWFPLRRLATFSLE